MTTSFSAEKSVLGYFFFLSHSYFSLIFSVTQDLEERTRIMKMKMKLAQQGQGLGTGYPESESRMTRHRDRHGEMIDRAHDRGISHDRIERMRERAMGRNSERGRDPERSHHRQRRHKGEGT